MNKRLVYFVWGEFFSYFFPILFSLVMLGAAYRLSTIGDVERVYLSITRALLIFFYILPFTLTIVIPISFLFSLSFTIIKLSLTGELTALLTSKISPQRLFSILLIPTIFIIFLSLLNSLLFKPISIIKLQGLLNVKSQELMNHLKPNMVNVIDEKKFLYVTSISNSFDNILYYEIHPQRDNASAIAAKKATLAGNSQLFFEDGTRVQIKGDDFLFSSFQSLYLSPFKEKYPSKISPSALPTKALFYIAKYDKEAKGEAVELWERFILPLTSFIFLLFVFPLSLKNQRSGYLKNILLSLAICITFFLIYLIVHSYSKKGGSSPHFIYPLITLFQLTLGFIVYRVRIKGIF